MGQRIVAKHIRSDLPVHNWSPSRWKDNPECFFAKKPPAFTAETTTPSSGHHAPSYALIINLALYSAIAFPSDLQPKRQATNKGDSNAANRSDST